MRIMPTLRPTRPRLIFLSFRVVPWWCGRQSLPRSNKSADNNWPALHLVHPGPGGTGAVNRQLYNNLELDLHVHSCGQIELHERVDGLVGGLDDVHQAQVRADLELVARSEEHTSELQSPC